MCYESNLYDIDPVEDLLMKKDVPAEVPYIPNKLYTEQKGVRDIKVVGLCENFQDLIDENYYGKMCPKPKLDVWV